MLGVTVYLTNTCSRKVLYILKYHKITIPVIWFRIVLLLVPMHSSPNSNLLPFLYFSFVSVIRYFTNLTGSTLSFVFTRSDCHLTNKTLVQGLKLTMYCYKWSWLTDGENVHWKHRSMDLAYKVTVYRSLCNICYCHLKIYFITLLE